MEFNQALLALFLLFYFISDSAPSRIKWGDKMTFFSFFIVFSLMLFGINFDSFSAFAGRDGELSRQSSFVITGAQVVGPERRASAEKAIEDFKTPRETKDSPRDAKRIKKFSKKMLKEIELLKEVSGKTISEKEEEELDKVKRAIGEKLIDQALCDAVRATGTVIVARPINRFSYARIADGASTKPLGIKAKTLRSGPFRGLIPCDLEQAHAGHSRVEIEDHNSKVKEAVAGTLGVCYPLKKYIGDKKFSIAVVRDEKLIFIPEDEAKEGDTIPSVLSSADSEDPFTSDLDLFLVAIPKRTFDLTSPRLERRESRSEKGMISQLEVSVNDTINSSFNELFHTLRDDVLGQPKSKERKIVHHGPEVANLRPERPSFPLKTVERLRGKCEIHSVGNSRSDTKNQKELDSYLSKLRENGYEFDSPARIQSLRHSGNLRKPSRN